MKSFDKKQPKFYKSMRMGPLDFGVAHYAGDVVYSVDGFVQKNKDALPLEIMSFMQSSSNPLIRTIFHESNDGSNVAGDTSTSGSPGGGRVSAKASVSGRRGSFMLAETVIQKFQRQLASLMATIGETDVQYVRCLKPNKLKSNAYYDRPMVVEQLRCAGMVEAIRISRAAYPYCVLHTEFVERFGLCVSIQWTWEAGATHSTTSAQTTELAERSVAVLRNILPDSMHHASRAGITNKDYEIGRTKTYFSNTVLQRLEAKRYHCVMCCVKIQARGRGLLCKKAYTRAKRSILLGQCVVRRRIAVKKTTIRRVAAIAIVNLLVSSYRHRVFHLSGEPPPLSLAGFEMYLGKKRYGVLLAEEKKRQETTKSLEAMKLRLKDEAEAAALAEEERQTLLRELEELRNEKKKGKEEDDAADAQPRSPPAVKEVIKEVIFEKVVEVPIQSTSKAEIDALTSVQADVARLQKALDEALEINKELTCKLNEERKEAENKIWHQKSRHLDQNELWKKEKAELVKSYVEITQLLDESQASHEGADANLKAAHKTIATLKMEKEEAEEKYILERYAHKRARAEMVEFLAARGVDQAALIDLNLAAAHTSSPSSYKGVQLQVDGVNTSSGL